MRPLCQAMLTHEYTYAHGAVDACTGELDGLILPHVNANLDALEDQPVLGLTTLETNPETVRTTVLWDWIMSSPITSLMKQKSNMLISRVLAVHLRNAIVTSVTLTICTSI
jgi:hypothetical protein